MTAAFAPGPRPFGRALLTLGLLVVLLAALASAVGLFVPGFYHRDPDVLQPQMLGQDLVTLVLAVPLLAASAWRAWIGSTRGYVLATGLLLYMAYAYATYAFATRFNALFLVYVAVLGMGTYALFLALARLPVGAVTQAMWTRMPRRSLAALLYAIAAAFCVLWLADVVPALLSGGVPQAAVESGTPTSPIHVLDLAFLLPLSVLAGTLLLLRRPVGVLLAGVMLVKAATISLAVLSMAAFAAAAGQAVNVPVAATMAVVLLAVLLLGAAYFRALGHGGDGAPARRRLRGVAR